MRPHMLYPDFAFGPGKAEGGGPTQIIYFQDGFESGNLSKWNYETSRATLNSNPSFSHSGTYSLQCRYMITNDGSQNISDDEYASQHIDGSTGYGITGLTDVFVRAYYYFKHPEAGALVDGVQRKINWVSGLDVSGGHYAVFLYHDEGGSAGKVRLGMSYNPPPGASASSQIDLIEFDFDQWVYIEQEIMLNTPGIADGAWRIWFGLDGGSVSQILNYTSINFRGSTTDCIEQVRFSDQATLNHVAGTVDEYRYIDDIVVANSRVGP